MTPDEAYDAYMNSVDNEPDLPQCCDIWHAALAYAASELRQWAKTFNTGETACDLADRLSPPPSGGG